MCMLVEQYSNAACVLNVSFGCSSDGVWVRGCRGKFSVPQCNRDLFCGFPPGASPSYSCSCNSDLIEQDSRRFAEACASNASGIAVHVIGSTWYGNYSTAFGHFVRGHLLATFARLERRCAGLWGRIGSLTFDRWPHQAQSMRNSSSIFEFYRALLPHARCCAVLWSRPAGAIGLWLSEPEQLDTDCEHSAPLAAVARRALSVPERSQRPLAITLVHRAGPRTIVNANQLSAALRELASERRWDFHELRASLTAREQLAIVAGTDIWVGMHGSADTLTGLLPRRSLVLHVLPAAVQYCLNSLCSAHEEMLWISLRSRRAAAEHPVTRGVPWTGVHISVTKLLSVLHRALQHDVSKALNVSLGNCTSDCARPIRLEAWMRQGTREGDGSSVARSWGAPIAPIADQNALFHTMRTKTVNEERFLEAWRAEAPLPHSGVDRNRGGRMDFNLNSLLPQFGVLPQLGLDLGSAARSGPLRTLLRSAFDSERPHRLPAALSVSNWPRCVSGTLELP